MTLERLLMAIAALFFFGGAIAAVVALVMSSCRPDSARVGNAGHPAAMFNGHPDGYERTDTGWKMKEGCRIESHDTCTRTPDGIHCVSDFSRGTLVCDEPEHSSSEGSSHE